MNAPRGASPHRPSPTPQKWRRVRRRPERAREPRGSNRALPFLSRCAAARATLRDRVRLYEVFLSHPVCFPFLFSLQHPLFSSLFSRENSVEIVKFWALRTEPSLRLVWAQNQPNFRPNRQNAGNFAENPCCVYTWKLPCDRLGILSIFLNFASDFAPDQLSDSRRQAAEPKSLCL